MRRYPVELMAATAIVLVPLLLAVLAVAFLGVVVGAPRNFGRPYISETKHRTRGNLIEVRVTVRHHSWPDIRKPSETYQSLWRFSRNTRSTSPVSFLEALYTENQKLPVLICETKGPPGSPEILCGDVHGFKGPQQMIEARKRFLSASLVREEAERIVRMVRSSLIV